MKLRLVLIVLSLLAAIGLYAQTPDDDRLADRPKPSPKMKTELGDVDGADAASVYDHEHHQMTCAGRVTGGGCRLTVDEGALVSLQVVRSVPGLLTAQVNKVDKEPDALSRADFQKLTGGVSGGEPETVAEAFESCPAECSSALGCFRAIRDRLDGLQRSIDSNLTAYPGAICFVRSTAVEFLEQIGNPDPRNATAVQTAYFEKLTADGQEAQAGDAEAFREFWRKLDQLLSAAPTELADFRPYEVEYADRDFDLELTFAPINDLIRAPADGRRVQVRLRNGWGVSTATALMVSGLADDVYTTNAYTVTEGETEVTKHRAVRESRDVVSPEIAFLVSLFPKPPSSLGRSILSVGVGLGQGSGGRLYGTWGYRFGHAGSFHFGVAIGKVKRLSKNINVADLGDVDPNASRRDVMRPSVTIGISWRLTD